MKQKINFVVCLLFGLVFINAGLDKFFHYMPVPKVLPETLVKAFTAFTQMGWLMPLVAVAELVGGTLSVFPKTRALGAVVIFPVMVGIFLTNTVTDTTGLPIAAVLLAINLWILYDNRAKYANLID